MFAVTKFSGEKILLNPELIKVIEKAGDTVITLTSGERILVKESPEELQNIFIKYKRICSGANPFNEDSVIKNSKEFCR